MNVAPRYSRDNCRRIGARGGNKIEQSNCASLLRTPPARDHRKSNKSGRVEIRRRGGGGRRDGRREIMIFLFNCHTCRKQKGANKREKSPFCRRPSRGPPGVKSPSAESGNHVAPDGISQTKPDITFTATRGRHLGFASDAFVDEAQRVGDLIRPRWGSTQSGGRAPAPN